MDFLLLFACLFVLCCVLEGTELLERGRLLGNLGLGAFDSLAAELINLLLTRVPGGSLDLPLGLELGDHVGEAPADLRRERAEVRVATHRLEAQHAQRARDNDALHAVVGGRHTLIDFEASEREGTTGRLVGEHAAHSLPEDLGGGAVVVGTTAGVGVATLVQIAKEDD